VVGLQVIKDDTREYYSVYCGGSHEEFTSRTAAVMSFGFGLSNGCRLKEYSREGQAYRWIVEIWDVSERTWKPDWDYIHWSSVLRQFWFAPVPEIRYLQNRLIDLDSEEFSPGA
jgi:hypothetical protein